MKYMASIFFILWGSLAWSIDVTGSGRAATEAEAKQTALQDLSSQIEIQISARSDGNQTAIRDGTTDKFTQTIRLDVRTVTDLPILGAWYRTGKGVTGLFDVEATLQSERSLPLYQERLKDLTASINTAAAGLARATTAQKELLLSAILTNLVDYGRYKAVATYLGATQFATPTVAEADIRAQLAAVSATIDTLDRAAAAIASKITANAVYIYPAMARDSTEITSFAAALRDKIQEKLKSQVAASPARAQFLMRGSYDQLTNGMQVSYQLLKIDGSVQTTISLTLQPQAYAGYNTVPATVDIDKAIRDGIVVSNDFRVEATTNLGRSDLLFKNKQTMTILVKLNRPGYLYGIEHVDNGGVRVSSMLQVLPEATLEPRKFIRRVSEDEVNRWLELGTFEVSAPFGVERLQLFASQDDPIDRLPKYAYDRTSQFYVLGKSIQENIVTTRGLVLKGRTGPQQAAAEYVLSFTTMP